MTDNVRSFALASSCAAFVGVPCLGALFGRGEQTARYDTVITPPDYAFAVWGPIFAGCIASTVAQCLPAGRGDPMSRRTGWPLVGAYAVNTAWSLAAQSGRFEFTPGLLPVATAFAALAYGRAQSVPPSARPGRAQRVRSLSGPAALTPASTGLLLGWTALASTVNLAAGAVAAGVGKNDSRLVAASTAAVLLASAAVAGGVARTQRGALPLALASMWGLATTALTRSRPKVVRWAAAAGSATIATAAAASRS
ncbi:hypothetical protein OWR29_15985 [Actinoplanes sp. Pm04-4]|uniref:Tryptophan-rich sensory protein n=1 Tax=Paractinoplanes pyxinae TaxID=2997416 RepID=A0ABT4B1K4_9ACTN|nr:hypothetical protein [Actinoplanes pyxinae]MCY1139498.1 hypothetical protein [Actinoplanes pyxinae]